MDFAHTKEKSRDGTGAETSLLRRNTDCSSRSGAQLAHRKFQEIIHPKKRDFQFEILSIISDYYGDSRSRATVNYLIGLLKWALPT